MLRRLLPTLLILGVGLLLLLWGLVTLQGIFTRERDEERASVRARREALGQYAEQALREALKGELDGARPRFNRGLRDPLSLDDGLLLRESGEQLLPRPIRFNPGTKSPARRLYHALRTPGTPATSDNQSGEGDSPWSVRVLMFRQFTRAVSRGDRDGVEDTFREILAHRARFVIAATRDLPYMVALLDFFSERSQPEAALMMMLLRTGIPLGPQRPGDFAEGAGTPWTGTMMGLQRAILRHRARFSRRDFDFLAHRVITLSLRYGVRHDDFAVHAGTIPRPSLIVPQPLDGPALILNRRYYAEPTGPGGLRGVAVSLEGILAGVRSEMRRRRMLAKHDKLELTTPARIRRASSVPVAALTLDVRSSTWAARYRDISNRYRLKTALGVLTGLLALIIAVLAVFVQQRKHRYLELKSRFVAGVSHELRTPLSSIRLLAETLERRTAGMPEVREYPQRIVRDVEGLSFLVENILSFSRLEKGRWRLRREPVAVAELLDGVADEIESATTAEVELTTEGLDGADLVMLADPELLRLLFLNLGRNACLYNRRDPVIVSVSAEIPDDADPIISVRDNGIGIAEEEQDRIFDEFYRAPDRTGRGVRGSGLGLAMCREIMEAHGGIIRVAASSPKGTTFELVFPASSVENSPA